MTRWEYLAVAWGSKFASSKWTYSATVTYPGGDKAKFDLDSEGNVLKLINQLGQEGWELVEVQPISTALFAGEGFGVNGSVATPVAIHWVFKRPASEANDESRSR